MVKDKQQTEHGLAEIGVGLDELVRRGAREVIQQAIESELATLLEQYTNVTALAGRQAVVRNGYLPEREVLTVAGPVTVKVPSPTSTDSASLMSPVEMPFRYSHGSAADTRGDFLTYGGTIAELNFTPVPERSRTFGTLSITGPAAVSTSRSGR